MADDWPQIDVERDSPTFAMLHLASQMIGKVRVANAAWVNHGWHVTLRPSATGLATLPTICPGGRSFTLAIDLFAHAIVLQISDGARDSLPFTDGQSISGLHAAFVAMLDRYNLPSEFDGRPNEIADAPRFADDKAPRRYNPASAETLRDALAVIVPIFETFRAGFIGKCSPVHFFWGSFDLAVTRFSGRSAPPHPGGVPGLPDRITREAYSHEVSSAGFWPGGVVAAEPIFYSYVYPEPKGFRQAPVVPDAAKFHAALGEFTLPYAAVRKSVDPERELMGFLQSTYEAAADLAKGDRLALEREPVAP